MLTYFKVQYLMLKLKVLRISGLKFIVCFKYKIRTLKFELRVLAVVQYPTDVSMNASDRLLR